jgi:hypothetical protein
MGHCKLPIKVCECVKFKLNDIYIIRKTVMSLSIYTTSTYISITEQNDISRRYAYAIFFFNDVVIQNLFFAILNFQNIFKDHRYFQILKILLYSIKIQLSIFLNEKTPFFTINYLADNFSENVSISRQKFECSFSSYLTLRNVKLFCF